MTTNAYPAAVMEVTSLEFPFVEGMPKRERSRLQKFWDLLGEIKQMREQHGQLIPPELAAKLIGVSQQRVDQLMGAGKLMRLEIDGRPFVGENSLVEFARSERKAGRPPKLPETKVGAAKFAFKCAKEIVEERKRPKK